ncbi:diguanylate cyclase (GGDEF)-like protein [Thermosipho japonicus]|uniref:Diguanylate cyclase (GGDEF)-like protein n=1 Tax=Thermosipho japonicus TaxID=90323 RepID=A0A841GPP1_9BACT|nr:GGDEF domain-containing protein [Thermosipho japonicus]MBB6063194.1 diguanylate cyclase (GGDEF)-like protein [Thermosipho japonicus]
MGKISDIIFEASETLKEKALFPLFSISVIDIIGTIEKEEFFYKMARTLFNIIPAVNGVEIFDNKLIASFGTTNGKNKDYKLNNIIFRLYFNKISQFEERLLKYILAIAEIHYRNVIKFEQVKGNSLYDELTGALTRKAGIEILQKKFYEIKRSNKKASIVFIDIDGLKETNDKLGHFAGDKLLREFVLVVKELIRKGDFIIRWGGDEFVLFLNTIDAKSVINRLESLIRTKFSWGVSIIPEGFNDILEAVEYADKLMYKQKFLKKMKNN